MQIHFENFFDIRWRKSVIMRQRKLTSFDTIDMKRSFKQIAQVVEIMLPFNKSLIRIVDIIYYLALGVFYKHQT